MLIADKVKGSKSVLLMTLSTTDQSKITKHSIFLCPMLYLPGAQQSKDLQGFFFPLYTISLFFFPVGRLYPVCIIVSLQTQLLVTQYPFFWSFLLNGPSFFREAVTHISSCFPNLPYIPSQRDISGNRFVS